MNEAEIAAAVIGITEVAKKVGLPTSYCPVFAIGLGIALTILVEATEGATPVGITGSIAKYTFAIVRGVIIGTTATGLYAVGGSVVDKATKK